VRQAGVVLAVALLAGGVGSERASADSGPSCTDFAITGDYQQPGTLSPTTGLTKLTFACSGATAKEANYQLQVDIRTPDGSTSPYVTQLDPKMSAGAWIGGGHEWKSGISRKGGKPFSNGAYTVGWLHIVSDGGVATTSCGLGVYVTVSLNEAGYGEAEKLVEVGSAKPAIAGCHVPGRTVSSKPEKKTPSWVATAKEVKATLPGLRNDEENAWRLAKDYKYAKAEALLAATGSSLSRLESELRRIKDVPTADDPARAKLGDAFGEVEDAAGDDVFARGALEKADQATGDAEVSHRDDAESLLDRADVHKQKAYVQLAAAIAAAG
jgi:hypothetical protein